MTKRTILLCAVLSACSYVSTNDRSRDLQLADHAPGDLEHDDHASDDPAPDASSPSSGTPDAQPVENDSWLDAPCETDADCGTDVCSALLRCAPASTLRTITVNWTASFMAASTTTCSQLGITTVMASLFSEESFHEDVSLHNFLVECSSGHLMLENVPPSVTRIGLTAFGNIVQDLYAYFVIDGPSLSFDMTQLPR